MNFTPLRRLCWVAGLTLIGSTLALADPWAPPGDVALRSDLQLLADEGVVSTPTTSWPLSWADVARDLAALRDVELRTPSLSGALARVRAAARRETRVGRVDAHYELSVAERPVLVRGFEDVPREDFEVEAGIDWTGERFAVRLQGTYAPDAADGRDFRPDGSYVGVSLGNLMVSAGYMEKWWGPGWAGSLILSSNARPVPSITVERNFSDPSRLPVLEWFGPWRASFQAGRLEGSRGDHPHAHFMALRLAARPARGLEIGVSRTAQLCGDGRACTPGTYWDMIVGGDSDASLEEQSGNQLAGYDFRWSPAKKVPVAVYGQFIGEDEAGFLPAKFLGLAGAEAWGGARDWTWRAYAEYSHTACDFARSTPTYGCAYESAIYTDGYRYRGRAIGHAHDRDSEGWTFGAVATRDGWSAHVRGYDVQLNEYRSGERHTLAANGGRLKGVEASVRATRGTMSLRAGVGYDDASGTGLGVERGLKAFLEWRHAT